MKEIKVQICNPGEDSTNYRVLKVYLIAVVSG
jgi:hypothetical protein